MIAEKIKVRNFRNIKEAEVTFSPGINLLYGNNAQGKTNLLEAVYYASIGKSFRAQHPQEMIAFGEDEAFLSLDFSGRGRTQNISVLFSGNRERRVEKNRVRITRMSELVGEFRAVLFCPEHLSLIKDGPAERRNFLDIAISARDPLYLASLQRYNRVLKQRNALIKKAEDDPRSFRETVEVWSRQLAHEGAYIARSRKRYIDRAFYYVGACFFEMSKEKEVPGVSYLGFCGRDFDGYENIYETEERCFRKLSENLEREKGAGATLYGIHKDDFEVTLNGRPARLYGSQGQQRSLSLSLKLAEGELCREDCGEYPVFLFDDVLSELDAGRRQYLLEKIKEKQVIFTTCEEAVSKESRIFRVEDGTYLPL